MGSDYTQGQQGSGQVGSLGQRCFPVLCLVLGLDWIGPSLCSPPPLSVRPFVALVISSIATALNRGHTVRYVCACVGSGVFASWLLVFDVIVL